MSSELGSIRTGTGIGGGIPIKELVDQSISQQFDPKKEKIGIQELEVQSKITSLGKLKSKLSELQQAAKKISDPCKLLGKTATVTNNPAIVNPTSTYLQVTANDKAQIGSYQIVVDQLAKSDKYTTNPLSLYPTDSAVIGTGTLNFTLGYGQSTAQSFQVVVDSQNNDNTLAGICRLINQQTATTGITSSVIKTDNGYYLSIGSNLSGLPSTLNITVTNDNGSGLQSLSTASLTRSVTAQNALIHIDSNPVTLTDNHSVDVIPGLTFDLYQTTGGLANTVQIKNDTSKALDQVKDFVEKYNEVIDFLGRLTRRKADKDNVYNRKYEDDADDIKSSEKDKNGKAEGKKRDHTAHPKTGNGVFIGDITILALRSALSQAVSTSVDQIQYKSMAQVGILSDKKTGKLEINEDRFKGALGISPNSVVNLFSANTKSGSSSNGVAASFDNLMESYVSMPNGRVLKATLNLSDKLKSIAVERLKIEKDSAQMEYVLTKKYANLDRALAKQKNTESSLMQSLDAMRPNEK